MSETRTLRLAVAQTHLRQDPSDGNELRESGRDVRTAVREAHQVGARVVHLPEGAMCSPHKHVMSADGPDRVGPGRTGSDRRSGTGSTGRSTSRN